GGSWLDDGFAPGQEIRIAGTDDNNGTFTIATVTADTITLIGTDVLVDAIDAQDVGITAAGTDTFRVDPTNGSPSANALGILRSDATSDLTDDGIIDYRDVNGIITGAVIGGTSLLDRFFIRDTELTGSL